MFGIYLLNTQKNREKYQFLLITKLIFPLFSPFIPHGSSLTGTKICLGQPLGFWVKLYPTSYTPIINVVFGPRQAKKVIRFGIAFDGASNPVILRDLIVKKFLQLNLLNRLSEIFADDNAHVTDGIALFFGDNFIV